MEAQNTSFSDILSNFIIYLLLAVLGYVVWSMLFGEGSSRKSFDYVGGAVPHGKVKVLKDNNVNARDKACVAVGLCHPEQHEFLSTEQLYKWRIKIMDEADKIFGKDKTLKTKRSGKRKK